MLDMELYQLRSFITVAETGNLTQASERLFTSQPAVSAHIKALEEELSIKLFERTARGMRLTEKGMVLREHAQGVLDSSNNFKNKAKALQTELASVVKIGLNSDTQYLRLADWHTTLITRYPHFKLELAYAPSVELLKQVSQGELDATFFSGETNEDNIEYIELFTTEAVVAGGIRYAQLLENADIEQLAEIPWIKPEPLCIYHKLINELFAETRQKPQSAALSAGEDSTLALLCAGAGLTFIRDDEAHTLLEQGKIAVWPVNCFSLPLRFAYHQTRRDDPSIKALVDTISQSFQ